MLAMALCLLLGHSARADDAADARAKELYENGADLYDEGRYDDAVAAWEEAYRLSNKALLLYNIANAEERAGRYRDALEHLNRYRAFATADERSILDRRISNLERRIQETGAEPAAPAPVVTAPPVTAPDPAPEPAPLTTASTATTTADPGPAARTGPPLATYVFGGVGVAGLAVGGVFGVGAITARGQAEGLCVLHEGTTLCPASAGEFIQKDKVDSLVADISLGVGAASLVTAVVFAFVDEPVGVAPLPGGGMVTFGGRF
jgi:HEPN domain-containing protein